MNPSDIPDFEQYEGEEYQDVHTKKTVPMRYGVQTNQTIRKHVPEQRHLLPKVSADHDYEIGRAVLKEDTRVNKKYREKDQPEWDPKDEKEIPNVVYQREWPVCDKCIKTNAKYHSDKLKLTQLRNESANPFQISRFVRQMVVPNRDCQVCVSMCMVTIESEVPLEVIDKKENKRMARKGKQVAAKECKTSSEENEEDEEHDEEQKDPKMTKYSKASGYQNSYLSGIRTKKQVLQEVVLMKQRSKSQHDDEEEDVYQQDRKKQYKQKVKRLHQQYPDLAKPTVVRNQKKFTRYEEAEPEYQGERKIPSKKKLRVQADQE